MTERGFDARGWALFLALAAMWGSSYFWIKVAVGSLAPFTIVMGRLVIGAVVLVVAVRVLRVALPRDRGTYGRLFALAVVNVALPWVLITFAEQSVDSALASILNATVPLFTVVIAARLLPEERITVRRLGGLTLGFLGVIVLVSRDLGGGAGSTLVGQLLMVGSSVCYAVGTSYARRASRGLQPVVPALFEVVFSLALIAPLALALEAPWSATPTPDALVAVAWLGVFGSGLAFLAYFGLIGRWGPTRTSVVAYVLPVVGLLLGVVVRGERADATLLLGGALILGGVVTLSGRRGLPRLRGGAPVRDAVPPV